MSQETKYTTSNLDNDKYKDYSVLKQETLEEAAEHYQLNDNKIHHNIQYRAFRAGVKWQQERMYSLMDQYVDDVMGGCNLRAKDWFEQFKNK